MRFARPGLPLLPRSDSGGLGCGRMLAAWYERPGPAADVLQVGDMADPEPGRGEVRIRVAMSGINPGDTKKRGDWVGYGMPYPRVIPHSDGAGVIDAIGDGVVRCVDRGSASGSTGRSPTVPSAPQRSSPWCPTIRRSGCPTMSSDDRGSVSGESRASPPTAPSSGDGSLEGKTVLVHGVLGGVGSLAAQLAAWRGATVIGTVRRRADLVRVDNVRRSSGWSLDDGDPVPGDSPARSRRRGSHHRGLFVSDDFRSRCRSWPRPGAVIGEYGDARFRGPRLDFLADALRQPHDPSARQ